MIRSYRSRAAAIRRRISRERSLIEIPGMGHDLPAALYSRIVDAIESVAKRARVGAS
jgi:hypothetical protein